MWGGKKARKVMEDCYSSSSGGDEAWEFENEVISKCTCDTYVHRVGNRYTVTIYGSYNSSYTVENDKATVKRLFNKHISSGSLTIEVK